MASVKVAVRVRPFNNREMAMKSKLIVHMTGKQTRLQKRARTSNTGGPNINAVDANSRNSKNNNNNNTVGVTPKNDGGECRGIDGAYDFTYDYSYWSFDTNDPSFVTQQQVYEDLGRDVIDCAFQGYNACVFAYGQTGSGKTYTMMGAPSDPGLIPRTCESLFERIRSGQESVGTAYKTTVSYLEIYNERVKDLLDDTNRGHTLKVRENQYTGPYVEDLSQHTVTCYKEIQGFINKGNLLRTTASTNMNETSSRSHAIFTIKFTQARFLNEMPSETASKIHLVDLAGSERAATTGSSGARLKEGGHINQSLVTLGIVIKTLAEQSATNKQRNEAYIPYRNSTLTRILKDSLGGNSKTIMIATISPADCNCTETLSTLRYANRAKNIVNTPTINEDSNVKLIRDLREEIQKLKTLLIGEASQSKPSAKVFADLKRIEQQEKDLTSEWTEKWSEIQAILHEQKALGLRKYGTGVMLESNVPHLIGIHDDTRTGVTLYSLREGLTVIGNGNLQEDSSTANEQRSVIPLSGDDILQEHCVIRLEAGEAIIEPLDNALCVLNGTPVVRPTPIYQGDFLLLGNTNMFRYNNPAEASSRQPRLSKDVHRSLLNLSQSSLMTQSQSTLGNSMFGFSDDEISFVWPMASERSSDGDNVTVVIDNNQNQSIDIAGDVKILSAYDLNSLKHLNTRERDLLARKEVVMLEKQHLEDEINFETIQICSLEVELERASKQHQRQSTSDSELGEDDPNANKRICELEEQLARSEIRLNKHSASMGVLNETIQSLEINHCFLIRTRRKFEDEALNLSRFNGSALRQKDIHEVPTATLATSSSTETSSSDNTASPDDHSAANEDTLNGNTVQPTNTSDDIPTCCAMQSLRHSIAFEKAKLMRNVEVNSDKSVLDEGIDRLHALQRQYFALEKQIEYGSHQGDQVCSCHREHDESPCVDKSLTTSITTSRSNSTGSSEYVISLPRFAVRGSGSSMHYEYEIAINLAADKWTIMRRYSRFREMHLTMKRRYGDAVAQIRFPRRQFFFAQTESVATRRRYLLEIYLRRLLVVCSKIPGCPLYEDESVVASGNPSVGLSKAALIQFSSFFLRGICECEYRSEFEESVEA